jgi:hypothetical protein
LLYWRADLRDGAAGRAHERNSQNHEEKKFLNHDFASHNAPFFRISYLYFTAARRSPWQGLCGIDAHLNSRLTTNASLFLRSIPIGNLLSGGLYAFGGLLDQRGDSARLRHIDGVAALDLDDC